MSGAAEADATLPKLLSGSRRWLFALLVLTGLAQAGAAGGTVLALRRGLRASTTSGEMVAVVVLFAASACVGWLRYRERLLSEKLGQIRGAAAAAHGAAMAAVVAASMIGGLSGAELAGALTVVGLLSAQVESLGRVVEYRQTFRAAERVLLPALAGASDPHDTEENREPTPAPARTAHDPAGLVVEHLRVGDHPDVEIPPLYAQAGDRVVVLADDRARGSVVLDTLVGLRRPVSGSVWVGGRDLESTTPRQRRKLLGYAAQGMRLERSSVARAVSYRRPDSSREKVAEQLSRVGLSERVATLSGGEQSLLRQGGEPLTPPDRARLFLARALLDDPPLLVLDHLDDELGERGRTHVHDLLVDYPGIVLIASESPDAVVTPTQEWHVS